MTHGEDVRNDTWDMWCLSLLKESSFAEKIFKSFQWEPGQLLWHSNLDIFLFEKKKKDTSCRFDSIRQISLSLPQRSWQKHCLGSCYFSTILPLLSLATTGGSSANRNVWTWSGFKPISYKCAFGLLKTLLLRLEFILMNSIMLTGSQQHSHHHCRHLCYNILQSSAYHDGPFWGNSVLGLSLTFLVTKRFNKPANMFVHTILELDASGMLRIVCG